MIENLLPRLALYTGGAYLLLNLFALLFSNRLLFMPQPSSYTHLPNELKIISGNGEKINAVYLEAPGAKYTLLFSHGNAEDLGNVVPFMQQFQALGYGVLMYDYRGYGTSEGTPSVHKTYQDVDAAYRWLVEEKKIHPQSIIAQGRSLGGGPSAWLAAHREVGGLMIESSFTSAFRVKTRRKLLPWDKFDNLKHIQQVNCPVFIMHGRDDQTLPFWHGEKLYHAAAAPKMHLWIDHAQHNDYAYIAGPRYFESFLKFVEQIEAGRQSKSTPK